MKKRRAIAVCIISTLLLAVLGMSVSRTIEQGFSSVPETTNPAPAPQESPNKGQALSQLETLPVKGRAPKAGYERSQFGNGWATVNGCSTRDIILNRDLTDVQLDGECKVVAGVLNDPYTGEVIHFTKESASMVQIDHEIGRAHV